MQPSGVRIVDQPPIGFGDDPVGVDVEHQERRRKARL